MTIYAYKTLFEDKPVIAIVAADTVDEMNAWWKKNEKRSDVYLTDILMDHMSDDELRMFKRPVVMITIDNNDAAMISLKEGFELVQGPNAAKSCQENMILESKEIDEYSAKTGDRRTIAEVTGTTKDDKWDKAVDETKTSHAPENVTGDGGQGGTVGKLKLTEEKLEEERGKIVERKTNKILISVREGRCSTHAVHELTNEMENDGTISDIVATSIRNSIPKLNDSKKEVKRLNMAEMRQYIEELNSSIVNTAQEVIDADANSIGVIRKEQDAQGNIMITALHRSAGERADALRQITQHREAMKKQNAKDEIEIHRRAKEVGLDPLTPGTATSVLADGRVAQEHRPAKVVVMVAADGSERKYYGIEEESEITVEQYDAKIAAADSEMATETETSHTETVENSNEEVDEVDELGKSIETLRNTIDEIVQEPMLVVEAIEINPLEEPENWVFAVKGDEDHEELVIVTRDYWEATGQVDDPGAHTQEWLNMNSYRYKGSGKWIYLNGSVTDGRNRLISHGCEELPSLTGELEEAYDWTIGKRGQRLFKDEEQAKDYYFAICPPGFYAEEETIFGHRTWLVMFPRKRFDNGENPAEQEDSISEKTLKKYGWESHGNNVFSVEAAAGQIAVGLLGKDATENGQLLYRMGLDEHTVPYDWPFQYKASGTRKSPNDFRQEAIRILEIARKQGIVLEDDQGVIKHAAPIGVDQDVVGNEEGDDITEDVLETLGTSLEEEKAKKAKKDDK